MDLEEKKALEKFGNFNSTHEIYGVLHEEVEEFFEIVRKKTLSIDSTLAYRKGRDLIDELKQIRAISNRAIREIENNKVKWL